MQHYHSKRKEAASAAQQQEISGECPNPSGVCQVAFITLTDCFGLKLQVCREMACQALASNSIPWPGVFAVAIVEALGGDCSRAAVTPATTEIEAPAPLDPDPFAEGPEEAGVSADAEVGKLKPKLDASGWASILKDKHKRALRKLRSGPTSAFTLAAAAGVSVSTIHLWCSPTKQGNILYQVGVRKNEDRQYFWPKPDPQICGTYRDNP